MDSVINDEIHSLSTSQPNSDIRNFFHVPIYNTAPDARAVDRWAYIWPYPFISSPTCNDGLDSVPCITTYNNLSVGNVQHYDNSHYLVEALMGDPHNPPPATVPLLTCSQAKNPPAKYGNVNDREMPYIVAPGVTPDPWWGLCQSYPDSGCIVYNHGPWCPSCGTSMSAPVLNAMATNVLAAVASSFSGMYYWPEYTRAALLVTAENVDSGYWDPENHDARDGAGTVSGANAVAFATSATDVYPGGDPAVNGLSAGELSDGEFPSYLWYSYVTPSTLPSGKHLRAVLTWDSSPGTDSSENELSDMDLYVQSNIGWHVSSTLNGNIEMLDIDNGYLSTNATYGILVYPTIFRKASDGPDYTKYSIAWTWVKDHAD
jgi:hypothetical protein